MRILRAHISNFRCLEDAEVTFDDVTTFIGPNGVGKSTILHALDWFFNEPLNASSLNESDRTVGSDESDIVVEVEFGDLSESDREQLGHYAPHGVDTVKIWRYRNLSGDERMTANAKAYMPFNSVRSAGSKTDIRTAYNSLRQTDPSLNLPNATSADAALDEMVRWESANPESLEDAPQELTTNFFGFNSQGKMSGLFDFVLVKADLRATEQVSDSKSTIIGRILERAIDRTTADEELATLSQEMVSRQENIYAENFREQLTELSAELTDAVGQYSQGRQITLKNENIEMKPPKTQFSVSISDDAVVTTVARQGHGFQRTLLISALQLLAKRGSTGDSNGTICLAIEEPELFQHPIQAQAFATVLRNLAEDRAQNIQVAYATHSPYFIEAGRFYQLRRLSRIRNGAGRAPTVKVSYTTIDNIKATLSGKVDPAVVDNQLDSTALHRLPEALFAKTVVLVEGTTDRALIEGVSERTGSNPLAVSGIVVADVGGKNNLYLPKAILEQLEIPIYVVFDGDKGKEERMRASGKKESDIQSSIGACKRDNHALLSEFGQDAVDWPETQVSSNFCVIEDTLESIISSEWPEWQIKADEITAQGAGQLRKNNHLYKDVTRLADGSVPTFFTELTEAVHTLHGE